MPKASRAMGVRGTIRVQRSKIIFQLNSDDETDIDENGEPSAPINYVAVELYFIDGPVNQVAFHFNRSTLCIGLLHVHYEEQRLFHGF